MNIDDALFAKLFIGPYAKASFMERQLLLRRAGESKGEPLTDSETESLVAWHKRHVVGAAQLDFALRGLATCRFEDREMFVAPTPMAVAIIHELSDDLPGDAEE